jgi:hypothetical protein
MEPPRPRYAVGPATIAPVIANIVDFSRINVILPHQIIDIPKSDVTDAFPMDDKTSMLPDARWQSRPRRMFPEISRYLRFGIQVIGGPRTSSALVRQAAEITVNLTVHPIRQCAAAHRGAVPGRDIIARPPGFDHGRHFGDLSGRFGVVTAKASASGT